MDATHIAPCGLNCALCSAFQRSKAPCDGCNGPGPKPSYCQTCPIRYCSEKAGGPTARCDGCPKYPCPRIKRLDKRYREKYGESLVANFIEIKAIGMEAFLTAEALRWACPACGQPLCAHKSECPRCGAPNPRYPREAHARTRMKETS